MIKTGITRFLLALALYSMSAPVFAQTVAPAEKQDELIQVLQAAGTPRKAKADACRQLSFIATDKAIPALAALLADEELNHLARYALMTIPGPAVDDALLDALGKLKGNPLLGVIGSIGERGDARAVEPLGKRLKSGDPALARAAARALGALGTDQAAAVLTGFLPECSGLTKLDVCEGLFRCAKKLGGQPALAIYRRLGQDQEFHWVRAGALRGAILTGDQGLALLKENLKNQDYILFSAAVQASMEMPGPAVTQILADSLDRMTGDHQILILGALAQRADSAALPAIAAVAQKGDAAVRIAAIAAIPPLGDPAGAGCLLALMKDADAKVAQAARESLAALPGQAVDDAILALLTGNDTAGQLKAIELLSRRRVDNMGPALLKAARDDDESVRSAAIRILGELDTAVAFPELIDLLLNAKGAGEIRAAELVLSQTCARLARPNSGTIAIQKAIYGAIEGDNSADVTAKVKELVANGAVFIPAANGPFGDSAPGQVKQLRIDFTVNGVAQSKIVPENGGIELLTSTVPDSVVQQLCAALPQAPVAQQLALLRVIHAASGPKALAAVRSAVKDANPEIASQAVSLLCNWPSVEALPDILPLTKSASDQRVAILALRGALRLIPLQELPAARKLAGIKEILPLIQRDAEKKLLLSALAAIPLPETLALVVTYLDAPATQAEAALAAVAISEIIASQNPAEVKAALQKVIATTPNADLKKRAREILAQ